MYFIGKPIRITYTLPRAEPGYSDNELFLEYFPLTFYARSPDGTVIINKDSSNTIVGGTVTNNPDGLTFSALPTVDVTGQAFAIFTPNQVGEYVIKMGKGTANGFRGFYTVKINVLAPDTFIDREILSI